MHKKNRVVRKKGFYKLINGDCLEIMKQIPEHSVDLVVTDPPYNIYTTGGGMYRQKDKQYIKELNGMKNGFSEEVLDMLCRCMKKINIYIWCSQKQIIPLIDYFVIKRGCNYNIITWHKTNPVPACGNKYLTDTEYCIFFREKGVKLYGDFKTKFTYYVTPLNQKEKKIYGHATIKPVNILKNLITNSSNKNDVVLDCYSGSGSTGVACIETSRRFIGIELNEHYFDVSCRRIEEAHKQKKQDYGEW